MGVICLFFCLLSVIIFVILQDQQSVTYPPAYTHTANEFRVVLSGEEDECDYICASFVDVSASHHTAGLHGQ